MKRKTLDIVYCGIFATITAILAQISIPLPGGVPLTLQTFAVSLAGILLGSKKGFISILVYVLMGAIGLPVFSGFSAGIGAIVGATGGFILSFPINSSAIIFASSSERGMIFSPPPRDIPKSLPYML